MHFELGSVRFDDYVAKFRERGGVIEERVGVAAREVRSPSVQLRITPLGKVELLSTHDQMLGGPSGQSYLGCVFPADPGYASAITRDAAKVGDLLRDAGVIGRFAIDFVVTRAHETALVGDICHRDQSAERRNHASFPDSTISYRRHLRCGKCHLRCAERAQ